MASSPNLPVEFTPVPVRPLHDGWTVERQIAFIEKLADCGSIAAPRCRRQAKPKVTK